MEIIATPNPSNGIVTLNLINWDEKENKCIAGFILIGSVDGGAKEEITISGEVLNFLSTGIDTRVYFIKNF